MNELTALNGKDKLTSLELLEQINFFRREQEYKIGLQHKDLLKAIRDEFEEEIGQGRISPSSYINSQNKQQPMYILTLSQAKQVLVRESKVVRKAVIAYIEKLEEKLRQPLMQAPTTMVEALTLALEQAKVIETQQKQIEAQKPLVEFAEHVSESANSVSVGLFAKIIADEGISMGQNRLFKWLRLNKYLDRDNIPYQRHIENNLFEVIEQTYNTPYGTKTAPKTLITGKGQIYFTEKLRKEMK